MSDVSDVAVEGKKSGRGWLKIGGIGCGSLILLCILFSVGAYLYTERQKTQLMEAAAENRTNGNYEAAIDNLNQVITDYADSEEAAEAAAMIPQVELEWAMALNSSGDFTAAQEKLEALMNEQSGDIAAQARDNLAFTYVGLAEQAIDSGDVPTAYEHYTYVFDNYDSGNGRQAATDSFVGKFTAPLFNFAQTKESEGVFSDAALGYEAIVQSAPDSVEAAQARVLLANAYYNWGLQLQEEGDFEGAIEKLQIVVNDYPNSDVAEAAAQALIDVQVADIEASGTAGALPPPQASGQGDGSDTATYDVGNDTICPILLLASGPDSQSMTVPPQSNVQSEFVPGTYNVVVQVDESQQIDSFCEDIIPFTGEYVFEGGYIYESSFYIETGSE